MKKFLWIGMIVTLLLITSFLVVKGVGAYQDAAVTLPWRVMGAGGTGATGGDITIKSTLGQPVAGPVTTGGVTNNMGFWYGLDEFPYGTYLPLVIR